MFSINYDGKVLFITTQHIWLSFNATSLFSFKITTCLKFRIKPTKPSIAIKDLVKQLATTNYNIISVSSSLENFIEYSANEEEMKKVDAKWYEDNKSFLSKKCESMEKKLKYWKRKLEILEGKK